MPVQVEKKCSLAYWEVEKHCNMYLYFQIKGRLPVELLHIASQFDKQFSAIDYTYNTMMHINNRMSDL